MKQIQRVSKIMLALMCLVISSSAMAADCSKVVDVMCKVFNDMAAEAQKCKTMEEMAALNYDNVINNIGNDEMGLPDSCMQYKLTVKDKARIKNSINLFSNTLVDKMYSLTDGVMNKEYIKSLMDSQMNPILEKLDKAVTFQDFADNF